VDKDVLAAVLMHHEKEDGSGYPTGLTSEKINLLTKIVSVADIFDAMTSNRVYKEKESPFEVFKYMEEDSLGKLSPIVVNVLLSNLANYYIGDRVSLSSGEIAEIVYVNPRCVSKPIIKIGDRYIDMLVEKDVKIKEIIA
jgi:HD-GYP domain-containing protein (c-di-GMP phosphodiesterase class II)